MELADETFTAMFGFCLIRTPEEERERAKEINLLFDAAAFELKLQSLEVFLRAGEGRETHRIFLSRVSSCPENVILFLQEALAKHSTS
jgi:hypothetical protein